MESSVTIQARKYDGRLHYEWDAKLLTQNESYALVYCEAGRTFTHHSKQKQFIMPYPSLEWFYFDQGYTVAISFKPEGLMYYCNIALPAQRNGDYICFTDLDLDYLKEVDEDWKVVDEDEFERHQLLFSYPDDIVSFAYDALEKLKAAVTSKVTPFELTEVQLVDMLKAANAVNN